ncbi:MAG: pyrroline-5-carboxylate reductase dimerization domain-containing protein [Candidatus Hermodarchaeota archaeon]
MIDKVGIIGVGHLASYLVEGLNRTSPDMEIILSPRNYERAKHLATKFGAIIAKNNQEVADLTDLIILSTRPRDSIAAAEEIDFHQNHIIISVAAGLSLDILKAVTDPATLIRAMPISSAAINLSPTLLYPDHPQVRALFTLLGEVLILPEESLFTPATTIAAFYGWVYALMNETINWTVQKGVPYQIAHKLVLKTISGAVEMSLAQSDQEITTILETLTTKGGITKYGLNVLNQKNGLTAWKEALDAVLEKLYGN